MAAPILNARDLDFMLYELFDAEAMTERERYSDHSRDTFRAAMETGQTVAEKYFLPIRKKVDTEQPTFNGKTVEMIPEIKVAVDAVVDTLVGFVKPANLFW